MGTQLLKLSSCDASVSLFVSSARMCMSLCGCICRSLSEVCVSAGKGEGGGVELQTFS